MYFSQYQYFLRIADEKSISKAGEKLCVSQPGMSKYIKRLEERVGAELIDRRSVPLKLTRLGEVYLKYAIEIADVERRFTEELEKERNIEEARVIVGTSQWRSSFVLPRLLPLLKQRCPRLSLDIKIEGASKIIEALLDGSIDFGILNLYSLDTGTGLKWQRVADERILLAVNREHPLVLEFAENSPDLTFDFESKRIFNINPKQLIKTPFTLISYSRIDRVASTLFEEIGLKMLQTQRVDKMVTALYYVSSQPQYITFIPESGCKTNFVPENLELFTIGNPPLSSPIVIIARKYAEESTMLKNFLASFRDVRF